MKIIHVEDYFDADAGYQINELLKIKSNNQMFLICSKDMSPFHKEYNQEQKEKDKKFEEKFNIKLIRIEIFFKIGTRIFYKNLIQEIKKINPDILFLHEIGDFKDLYFLLSSKKKYLIFRDCHMSWIASKNKFANLYYKIYSLTFAKIINKTYKYQKIYALGKEEKEYLEKLGIDNEKIQMLPHGYNEKIYYKDNKVREEIRKELKIQKEDILISYIGKFDNLKKPHLNLEIFIELGKSYIEKNKIKFLFLGPKQNKYMDEVFYPILKKIDFENRIIMEEGKNSEELNKYYNASDICLWPQETTLSSIHAQITGTTCVMESHSSNIERVVDNKNLFEVGNLNSALEVLKNIIENKKYLKESLIPEELKNREYHIQIKTLYEEWEALLKK